MWWLIFDHVLKLQPQKNDKENWSSIQVCALSSFEGISTRRLKTEHVRGYVTKRGAGKVSIKWTACKKDKINSATKLGESILRVSGLWVIPDTATLIAKVSEWACNQVESRPDDTNLFIGGLSVNSTDLWIMSMATSVHHKLKDILPGVPGVNVEKFEWKPVVHTSLRIELTKEFCNSWDIHIRSNTPLDDLSRDNAKPVSFETATKIVFNNQETEIKTSSLKAWNMVYNTLFSSENN